MPKLFKYPFPVNTALAHPPTQYVVTINYFLLLTFIRQKGPPVSRCASPPPLDGVTLLQYPRREQQSARSVSAEEEAAKRMNRFIASNGRWSSREAVQTMANESLKRI